ncbi:organic hydroperoxide resistance protein [Pseudoruegeria sp. HB172150]|uniref:organic hydroperoxide resistance protein n=1 Tax=Pseudoruegeria sp. HB172150 TaxID=2721164 RepID=UPI001552E874|nr:organic hydroperoxide resistance protein [Pseudoruegeria sp. HB172150]
MSTYETTVTATGGRNGHIESSDGFLSLDLVLPQAMGGEGGASNPEQLFAGGYAACFGSAIMGVAKKHKAELSGDDVTVNAKVGVGPNGTGGFGLTVKLETEIKGVDQATAEAVVESAHKICPYSNATRGNVDVELVTKAV